MNMLILTVEQRAAIEALNAGGDPRRELQAVWLQDGRYALNADLLADCAAGQTWEHYGALLATLPVENIDVPQAA